MPVTVPSNIHGPYMPASFVSRLAVTVRSPRLVAARASLSSQPASYARYLHLVLRFIRWTLRYILTLGYLVISFDSPILVLFFATGDEKTLGYCKLSTASERL